MAEFQRCIEERDRGGAEVVLDEDYALVRVNPALGVMPREQWLEVLKDYVVHEYVVDEQQIDVDGDDAAVLTKAQMLATVLGEPRNGTFIISDFWRRRDGRWRVWRRHSTPLTAGEMPGET
jgi:hypothetical protein